MQPAGEEDLGKPRTIIPVRPERSEAKSKDALQEGGKYRGKEAPTPTQRATNYG